VDECKPLIHGCDIITRLSGPCLLKLRRDMVDALVRCKVSKFSLLARVTCAAGHVEENDILMPPGQGLTLVHFSAQLEPCLIQETTLHTLDIP